MNFKITKLEIENFRSIQDKVTLSLKPGLFSIEGINYTETNSTNGCGKSTLISALFWAFTGSSLTNEVLADEGVNLKTNKNCRVSVYIETEKDEIKVTRVRKDVDKGNNLMLEINGQDLSCHKVADTQDRINKLIKIPFDLLKNTIIMTSGMESAFSGLTPQQRINTLESIRDSDGIAQNATKVFSLRQHNNKMKIKIVKCRMGSVGQTFCYDWDINYGKFEYNASPDEVTDAEASVQSRYQARQHEPVENKQPLTRRNTTNQLPF